MNNHVECYIVSFVFLWNTLTCHFENKKLDNQLYKGAVKLKINVKLGKCSQPQLIPVP